MFDLFGVAFKEKKMKELGEGFSIYKVQRDPDYAPIYELREKRRWWGEKLRCLGVDLEPLEDEFERIMEARKAWEGDWNDYS